MDGKQDGTGLGQTNEALTLGTHKLTRAPFDARCPLIPRLVQIGVDIDQRVHPPQRLIGADHIEHALDAAGEISLIDRDGPVDAGQGAAQLFGQRPTGGKAQTGPGQEVLVALFFQQAQILLHQTPQGREGPGPVHRNADPVRAGHGIAGHDIAGRICQQRQDHVKKLDRGGFVAGHLPQDHIRLLGDQPVTQRHLRGKGVVGHQPVRPIDGQHPRQAGGARVHPRGDGQAGLQDRCHGAKGSGNLPACLA